MSVKQGLKGLTASQTDEHTLIATQMKYPSIHWPMVNINTPQGNPSEAHLLLILLWFFLSVMVP